MKHTPLILSIIALVAVVALGIFQLVGSSSNKEVAAEATETEATSGAIVYYNLDKVLQDYDMANELRSAVQAKIQGIQEEVNRRGQKLQNDANSFQEKISKGLITRSVAEVQGQKIQAQQNEFQNYAAQKEQEIAEEQQVMLNQLADAIATFLEKYNAEKHYAMIIANQGDILPSPISIADPALDVTEEILAGLNEEYVKEKAKSSK